jgi:hypothetical protein
MLCHDIHGDIARSSIRNPGIEAGLLGTGCSLRAARARLQKKVHVQCPEPLRSRTEMRRMGVDQLDKQSSDRYEYFARPNAFNGRSTEGPEVCYASRGWDLTETG